MVAQFLLAVSFVLPNAEFARYHREITGRDPEPNAVTFAIDPKVSQSGMDAYVIRSDRKVEGGKGGKAGVRIIGSNLRSVWYGLYDLLERRGGCHWYWDEDIVPKQDAIDLSGLDVKEEAHFEYRGIRYFAHRGLTRFQAEHWGPEDWRREIDWLLKRRLNVFMLRIGTDDLFQRAFPETCAYPDPSKDLPGHGRGYDNRTLFWSLEYRSKLRQTVQWYGCERGLMIPEDFGTMTHWYSRTPEDFLAKKNPPFLPQATDGYGERNGLVWDYEGDSTRDYREEMLDIGGNNFTKWGVVGKFPYTYSIFLAYESALDIRANYPLIEARQKIVQNDPMCVGYILWPEASHTDTLLLEYFTANAWSRKNVPVAVVLDEFCAGRYGTQAAKMKAVWKAVIPISRLLDWGDNYGCHLSAEKLDLARTALDRLLILKMMDLNRAYDDWVRNPKGSDGLVARADELVFLSEKMADLLELHTDYSIWESYGRLDRIEKIRNPNFSKVLFENATCGYCRSHQYEAARHFYLPRAQAFASRVRDAVRTVASGRALDPAQRELRMNASDDALRQLGEVPLETLRPTAPRTSENFHALMCALSNH